MRVAVRIALLPVIAGISYEVLKAAGNSDNPVINLLSMPGLGIQRLTTKEPDDGMIEVAIQAWRPSLTGGNMKEKTLAQTGQA